MNFKDFLNKNLNSCKEYLNYVYDFFINQDLQHKEIYILSTINIATFFISTLEDKDIEEIKMAEVIENIFITSLWIVDKYFNNILNPSIVDFLQNIKLSIKLEILILKKLEFNIGRFIVNQSYILSNGLF